MADETDEWVVVLNLTIDEAITVQAALNVARDQLTTERVDSVNEKIDAAIEAA